MMKVLHVEGMSCSHCVAAVTQAVSSLDGVSDVQVDLEAKTVTVEYEEDKVIVPAMEAAIEEQGYTLI